MNGQHVVVGSLGGGEVLLDLFELRSAFLKTGGRRNSRCLIAQLENRDGRFGLRGDGLALLGDGGRAYDEKERENCDDDRRRFHS